MDVNDYKNEVSGIETQVASMNLDKAPSYSSDVSSSSSSSFSLASSSKFKTYIPYGLIVLLTGLLIWIIKPKVILKIVEVDSTPTMKINVGRFMLTWAICILLFSALWIFYLKKKFNY